MHTVDWQCGRAGLGSSVFVAMWIKERISLRHFPGKYREADGFVNGENSLAWSI
jgi:hypothetical protein